MSEVAGRLAAHAAGHYLMHPSGGPGLLLGGSPGVPPARVTVLGGGVVGTQAALLAVGMRADVTILDTSPHRVRQLEEQFGRQAQVLQSQGGPAISAVRESDVVIGAVLVPGAAAPQLLTRDDLRLLRPGALLIDVAIDQGGCFETSRATTYEAPTYQVDGITHYCVANMPGAVPRTSTRALTNATLPYVRHLAGLGVDAAFDRDPGLRRGLNTRRPGPSPTRPWPQRSAEPTAATVPIPRRGNDEPDPAHRNTPQHRRTVGRTVRRAARPVPRRRVAAGSRPAAGCRW